MAVSWCGYCRKPGQDLAAIIPTVTSAYKLKTYTVVALPPVSRGKLYPNLSLSGCICSFLKVYQKSVKATVPRVIRKKPKGRRNAPLDILPSAQQKVRLARNSVQ